MFVINSGHNNKEPLVSSISVNLHGEVVITIAHSAKPGFCTGLEPAYGVSEPSDCENH